MKGFNTPQPPKLALQFFRWYCRQDRVEELEGDLEEIYSRKLSSGASKTKADLFFWWNVIRCFKSYARSKNQNKLNTMSLYKTYAKLAFRHSWKNKWAVLINILGLGIALSMCITVYIIYAYNVEFDTFYENTDDIYRIHSFTLENGEERRNEAVPLAMESRLQTEISGIEDATSYFARRIIVKSSNDYFSEYAAFASSNFFSLFDIPLKYGSFAQFGKQPTAYLTEELSVKYFGDLIPVGKIISVHLNDTTKYEAMVGGVFNKISLNSSFDFNLLLNIDDYARARKFDKNDWGNKRNAGQYLRITDATKRSRIEESIQQYIPFQNEGQEELKMHSFQLVPFLSPLVADQHLSIDYVNNRLRPAVLIIFIVLVSLILFTACFNMANTSMAMISNRLKEIGIRKTLGSASKQILVQFLFEMGIVSVLAFIVALSTANITSNSVFGLFGVSFIMTDVSTSGIAIFVAIFLVITTLISGLMPALYAWKFQPVSILRNSVKLKGVSWLNKVLTVAQYSFSIAVLIVGFTFSLNSDYLEAYDVGYEKEAIFDLQLGNNEYYKPIKQQIDQIPGIVTAGTKNHFANFSRFGDRTLLQIDTNKFEVDYYEVGEEYLDIMKLDLIAGRSFLKGSKAERERSVVVNNAFVKHHFDGKNAINQTIKIDGERKTVIGVSVDIIDSFYEDSTLEPTVYALTGESDFTHLIVKVENNDLNSVESQLRDIWREHIDKPYNGHLQKDVALGTAGRDSTNLKKIFLSMAVLGCFLSIVGIFSLASLNVAKRNKEISIRKVLGASIKQLLVVINRSFIKVLLLSMFVGATLGYVISNSVMEMIYTYHIDVSLLHSIFAGIGILIISLITITFAVINPASANPSVGLRDE